jgi:solute carrier family 35 protein E3
LLLLLVIFLPQWVGTKQKELGLDSMQLLFNQAPISAVMLLFLIPVFEDPREILSYPYDTQSVVRVPAISLSPCGRLGGCDPSVPLTATPALLVQIAIFVSSVLAFCVNLSIFLVIGRTSAVTYVSYNSNRDVQTILKSTPDTD